MNQVTKIKSGHFGEEFFTTYNFKSGHVLRKYLDGRVIAYTPSGNYASQPTMYKLIATARDHAANEYYLNNQTLN
jgi:hypothetical protein